MIGELYNLIEKSNLVLIGYTSEYEDQKDSFISNLNPHVVDRVDNSFSVTQFLRERKIDSVLSESEGHSKYIVIDSSCIRHEIGTPMFEKPKFFRKLSERLRYDSIKFGFIPIIVFPMYNNLDGSENSFNFSAGSGPMYASDLVIRFGEKGIKLIKSRYSGIFEVSYDELEDSKRELIVLKNPNRFF